MNEIVRPLNTVLVNNSICVQIKKPDMLISVLNEYEDYRLLYNKAIITDINGVIMNKDDIVVNALREVLVKHGGQECEFEYLFKTYLDKIKYNVYIELVKVM